MIFLLVIWMTPGHLDPPTAIILAVRPTCSGPKGSPHPEFRPQPALSGVPEGTPGVAGSAGGPGTPFPSQPHQQELGQQGAQWAGPEGGPPGTGETQGQARLHS